MQVAIKPPKIGFISADSIIVVRPDGSGELWFTYRGRRMNSVNVTSNQITAIRAEERSRQSRRV